MGGRTGKYRMGTEYTVLIDPDNKEISIQQNSQISMEDFAVCMIDEVSRAGTTSAAILWAINM